MEGFKGTDPVVMPDEALVPARNWISPAPNQFTHKLKRPQPYYYDDPSKPKGTLPAGAKVVLLFHDGGTHCRVVDGRGLYVAVEFDSLESI